MTPSDPHHAFVIGLIGGIGAGKSTVAALFEEMGALRIDADRVAHRVLQLPSVKRRLQDLYGKSIIDEGGRVGGITVSTNKIGAPVPERRRLSTTHLLHVPHVFRGDGLLRPEVVSQYEPMTRKGCRSQSVVGGQPIPGQGYRPDHQKEGSRDTRT